MDSIILHCDLNSFFASASCLSRPELNGRPVAVCGDAANRHGIILAKNQEAKRMGVKTAQTIWQALLLCPDLVTLPPEYPLYMTMSDTVKNIYERYTGRIEPFGIDECWLDVTPYAYSDGFGERIAHDIRRTVKRETGLTVSVGVSWNKIFAKLGSDYKKPDAVTVIERRNYQQIAWPLPVKDLLYVGRATRLKLEAAGINTIGDLANTPLPFLRSYLGKNGVTLHAFAAGQDLSPVKSVDHPCGIKGIGNSMTTKYDLKTDTEVRQAFLLLSEMVARRARKKMLQGRTVAIFLRAYDLSHMTRQTVLPHATFISDEIARHAMMLYKSNWDARVRPIRAVGVRIQNLTPIDRNVQLCFFDMRRLHMQSLEFTKDDLQDRFGTGAVIRASLLNTAVGSRHPKEMHDVHPLSYFRS